VSETSYQNGYHQRSAGKAELDRSRHTRKCNGKTTAQDTQEDAHKQCDNVRFVEAFQRVTKYAGYPFYSVFGAYYHDTVTYLQYQVGVSKQVDTRTVDTGNVDIIHAAEVQHTELLSVYFRFGYQDTT